MEYFKVLKAFESPLVGDKHVGDIIHFGVDAAKKWLDMGLIEPLKTEKKPQKRAKVKK